MTTGSVLDMTPRRSLALTAALVSASVVLAACSSSADTGATNSAPAATTAASPAATGAPSAELTAWAGQVCDDTAGLRDSVTGIASAVVSGGTDIGATLQSQFTEIGGAASQLVTTVQAIPADGSSPQAQSVKESADASKAAIDALGASITELANAGGLGAVAALPGVGSAAKDASDALGATVSAIDAALKDGKSTLGQAFAANPSCTALNG